MGASVWFPPELEVGCFCPGIGRGTIPPDPVRDLGGCILDLDDGFTLGDTIGSEELPGVILGTAKSEVLGPDDLLLEPGVPAISAMGEKSNAGAGVVLT